SGSTPSTDNRWTTSSLMRGHHLYVKCGKILGPRRRGRALEQRARRSRLGKCNNVPHRLGPGNEHHGAVESDGEPAVRRRPGGERAQQEAETRLDLRGRQAEVPEYRALDGGICDTNRSRPELVAVVDRVIMQCATGERIAVELAHVFGMWRR